MGYLLICFALFAKLAGCSISRQPSEVNSTQQLVLNNSGTFYFDPSQLITGDLNTNEQKVLFELNPYRDTKQHKDPEDLSLGFIDHITGWSPSRRFMMVESFGFNNRTSVCLIDVDTTKASCDWKINDWDVPF